MHTYCAKGFFIEMLGVILMIEENWVAQDLSCPVPKPLGFVFIAAQKPKGFRTGQPKGCATPAY